MRSVNKKNYIIYILIILIILFNYIFASKLANYYNLIIAPLMWIITYIISNIILFRHLQHNRYIKDKIEIIAIIMLFYFIIYFLSGLIFTFAKSIYALDFISIVKNIWIYIGLIIFKELTRNRLIDNTGKNKIHLIIITILFILGDISFVTLMDKFTSTELIFKYSFQIIAPVISQNILCTYLAYISNSIPGIIFRVILISMKIFTPVQPNFDWFVQGMFESFLPIIIYVIIAFYHIKKTSRENKSKIKRKRNWLPLVIGLANILLTGLFFGGFLKYMPVAVMSGSMVPIFERGDIVVVEKIDKKDFNKIALGDIISYRMHGRVILHRVININTINSENVITTKGDNNDEPDKDPVYKENIVGIIRFKIKYVGYPSVLIGEYFSKN